MSLDRLGEISGLTPSSISRIERGQEPTLEDARALAKALGVTLDFLFPLADQETAVG